MHTLPTALAVATIGLLSLPAAARTPPSLLPAATGDTLRVAFDAREPRLLELTRTRNGWRGQLTSDGTARCP